MCIVVLPTGTISCCQVVKPEQSLCLLAFWLTLIHGEAEERSVSLVLKCLCDSLSPEDEALLVKPFSTKRLTVVEAGHIRTSTEHLCICRFARPLRVHGQGHTILYTVVTQQLLTGL